MSTVVKPDALTPSEEATAAPPMPGARRSWWQRLLNRGLRLLTVFADRDEPLTLTEWRSQRQVAQLGLQLASVREDLRQANIQIEILRGTMVVKDREIEALVLVQQRNLKRVEAELAVECKRLALATAQAVDIHEGRT
jgi:hypothetical protein